MMDSLSAENFADDAATSVAHVEANHVARQLMSAFGSDRVELIKDDRTRRPNPRFRIRDETVRVVAFPHSTNELSEMLKLAHREQWRVVPAGAGTWFEMGNAVAQQHLILSTACMNYIREYEPADLTCTVEAGTALASFNQRAAEHNQFIPLDPFGDARSTLGAIVATGSYGTLRGGYGTPRDWLIGICVVHADGTVTRAGGKVVKNVAGYDLCKLYAGSYGTLAVIAELSFKLRALPQARQTLVFFADDVKALLNLRAKLNDTDLQPSALELLAPQPGLQLGTDAEARQYALVLGFLNEERETCDWQCQAAIEHGSALKHSLLNEGEAATFWASYHASESENAWEFMLRFTGLPADLPKLLEDVKRWLPTGVWRAHAANGVLRVFGDAGLLNERRPRHQPKILRELREAARARGGQLVIMRAPAELKSQFDAWGDQGELMPLMRALKTKYDPQNRLNFGRFVAGI